MKRGGHEARLAGPPVAVVCFYRCEVGASIACVSTVSCRAGKVKRSKAVHWALIFYIQSKVLDESTSSTLEASFPL